MLLSLIRIHLQSYTCCILSGKNYQLTISAGSWIWCQTMQGKCPRHIENSRLICNLLAGFSLRQILVLNILIIQYLLFQKSQHVVFQINAQRSFLFRIILKIRHHRINTCNHWNVFNKNLSEKWCSRIMLFCSCGSNSWKIPFVFMSHLFKMLTLSEVLSKILNKVLWQLFWRYLLKWGTS